MRRLLLASLTLAIACSRETPAPTETAAPVSTGVAPEATATTTRIPDLQKGTYDEALLWFRSTKGFDFVLEDQGVHAEGSMSRLTPGTETVQFRANGTEWRAETTAQGVSWKRRDGNRWTSGDAPDFGARIYQRVTLPFDPQKKEGVPLLVSEEGTVNLYRFTNANSGETHEIEVRKTDARIERMKIGEKVDLRITGAR